MKRRLLYLALLASVACYGSQQSACETGRGPTPLPPTPTPTATPSPTPAPSPTPVVLNCRVDFLRVTGPESLARGESGRYDLTPMQIVDGVSQQTPDPCNEPLATSVEWSLLDRAAGSVAGNGFAATVTRFNSPFTNPPAPLVLRVSFKGTFAEKVIL